MLTVVCWKWEPLPGYRSRYLPEVVNVLRRMVDRHYPDPHRFVCVTEDATGIDPGIEILPPWNDYVDLPSPHGGKNPSCYRRLRMFAPGIEEVLGKRFVSLDLDCVILRDLRPVWNRSEEFVMWGDTNPNTHYNGSMLLMTAGARSKVWTTFHPKESPRQAKSAGFFGSDQGWISYCLGKGEATWTRSDGVYSYRNHIEPNGKKVPKDARIVFFHGCVDPWTPSVQWACPWVRDNWR